MRVPMSVCKLMVMVPAMLVSGVLALMVLAVLPPVLGLLGFLACGVVLVVVASGGLEGPAVRLLTRAREATEGERAVLAPVLVAQGGTGMPAVALYVRRAPHASTPPALVVGTWLSGVSSTPVTATASPRAERERYMIRVARASG